MTTEIKRYTTQVRFYAPTIDPRGYITETAPSHFQEYEVRTASGWRPARSDLWDLRHWMEMNRVQVTKVRKLGERRRGRWEGEYLLTLSNVAEFRKWDADVDRYTR